MGIVYFILWGGKLSERDIFVVFHPPMIYTSLKLRKRTPLAILYPLPFFQRFASFRFSLSFASVAVQLLPEHNSSTTITFV